MPKMQPSSSPYSTQFSDPGQMTESQPKVLDDYAQRRFPTAYPFSPRRHRAEGHPRLELRSRQLQIAGRCLCWHRSPRRPHDRCGPSGERWTSAPTPEPSPRWSPGTHRSHGGGGIGWDGEGWRRPRKGLSGHRRDGSQTMTRATELPKPLRGRNSNPARSKKSRRGAAHRPRNPPASPPRRPGAPCRPRQEELSVVSEAAIWDGARAAVAKQEDLSAASWSAPSPRRSRPSSPQVRTTNFWKMEEKAGRGSMRGCRNKFSSEGSGQRLWPLRGRRERERESCLSRVARANAPWTAAKGWHVSSAHSPLYFVKKIVI